MTKTQRSPAVSSPQAYRENLFRLLGRKSPLRVLAQTAPALDAILRKHPAKALRTRPGAGKWTPNEVIGHLTDSEWVYGYRLRLILSQENPAILATDQDSWVARQRHNDREPSELVEMFRTMRRFNLAAWESLSGADFKRSGQHNERGREPLGMMLRMMAGHDLSHLEQIRRLLRAM
jgi:hypothetical protein